MFVSNRFQLAVRLDRRAPESSPSKSSLYRPRLPFRLTLRYSSSTEPSKSRSPSAAVAGTGDATSSPASKLVDLDAARAGGYTLAPLLQRIADDGRLQVQTGGGVRYGDAVQAILDAGAARVVVGSLAFALGKVGLVQALLTYTSAQFVFPADCNTSASQTRSLRWSPGVITNTTASSLPVFR